MTPFLLYIARGGLYLSLFYAFYLLVMRRTTFFRMNRVMLLAGSYLCLLLPVIRLRAVTASSVTLDATTVDVVAGPVGQALRASFPWNEFLMVIYLVGAVIILVLYLISAWEMRRMIRKGKYVEREGCNLVLLDDDSPSFSWGRNVVISSKDLQEYPVIFTHELMHVQCRHSRDLIAFLPIQLFFWWNPLVWITRQELRLLHEYEADEGVIQKGIDATEYQLLLVKKAVGEQRFSMANGFQHAKLKNRITMMLKPTSSSLIRFSYLILIPVLAGFMFACNPSKKTADQGVVPFQLVEDKPSFNGGDIDEFSKWVNSQLKYPEQAKEDGIQGRMLLEFTVGTDGTVSDVKVLRGVREDLDAEAVRVISSSPKWTPGKQHGKVVPVSCNYPIVFQLR